LRLTNLKVDSKEGVLVATAAGRVSLSEAISVFTKACDVGAERGFDRILVGCLSVEGELSTMERYELGKTMAEYCNSRSITAKSRDGRQTAFDKRLRSAGGLESRSSCRDVFGIAESIGLAEGIGFKGCRSQGRLTTTSIGKPVSSLHGTVFFQINIRSVA
jgi:hypothetical protein